MSILPAKPIPGWLSDVDMRERPPMRDLLASSVYYPCCGKDGRPVQYFAGFAHSFVYTDYGISGNEIESSLAESGAFFGYGLICGRFVERTELIGDIRGRPIEANIGLDGNPERYRERRVEPYAYWAVFDRLTGPDDSRGPARFSLLYLGSDGVDAYQDLYHSHGVSPSMVAIIQPGEGFGWNWTAYFDPARIFCRTVLDDRIPAPKFLLAGGYGSGYRNPTWPRYKELVRYWKTSDGRLGLWKYDFARAGRGSATLQA